MKKAFGLAEVIVAIGIFGTVMVVTVSMTVAALRTVKDNELADMANSVMVTSLEYVKSPAGFEAIQSTVPSTGALKTYKIKTSLYNPDNPSFTDFQLETTTETNRITTCDDSSPFLVKIAESSPTGAQASLNNFKVCNQILIQTASNQTVTITSVVVYVISDRVVVSELVGFKSRL